jgi:LacI family transcriptional regulator
MAKNTVKMSDIASEVGLSRTTVSYILNNCYEKAKIAPMTAKRVMDVARKMGYQPNYWARSLVSQKSMLIGVVFPDLNASAAHEMTRGIQQVLGTQGYNIYIGVYFWDPELEAREINFMRQTQVEGIIALPHPKSKEVYANLVRDGFKLVFLGDYLPEVNANYVVLNAEDAASKIIKHLYQLGHRNIHLLSVDLASQTLLEREQAFEKEIIKHNLPFSKNNISRAILANPDSVSQKVERIMNMSNRPTALVCISDALAVEATTELSQLRYKIPQDIAVTGIGNLSMAANPFFSISTVQECREAMGRSAAELMIQQFTGKSLDKEQVSQLRVKGDFIERSSTIGKNS